MNDVANAKPRMRRLLSALAMGVALVVAVPAQPAAAASGGGCRGDYPIRACISLSGSGGFLNLVADFYNNSYPDPSRCWAQMEIITTNVGTAWSDPIRLNRNGRFGPKTVNVVTAPPSSGSAINRVHIYTCTWVKHGYWDSPRQHYP